MVKAAGKNNIPDGEVFTSPVRDSVNGTLAFNTPSLEDGVTYERVRFTFKDGKIVDADANEPERLQTMLDTDEGARYLGEFALGLNPRIDRPMKDTLYDEKIGGSLHLTPGRAYEEADNGNRSSIHWDLVLIQTPKWGGGEIYFDDVLVRKDGLLRAARAGGTQPRSPGLAGCRKTKSRPPERTGRRNTASSVARIALLSALLAFLSCAYPSRSGGETSFFMQPVRLRARPGRPLRARTAAACRSASPVLRRARRIRTRPRSRRWASSRAGQGRRTRGSGV